MGSSKVTRFVFSSGGDFTPPPPLELRSSVDVVGGGGDLGLVMGFVGVRVVKDVGRSATTRELLLRNNFLGSVISSSL